MATENIEKILVERAGSQLVRDYIGASVCENTRKAYGSDWKKFTSWCIATHKPGGNECLPLPALPETVAQFAAELAAEGKAYSTISRILSTISKAHKVSGHYSPIRTAVVSQVMKGIRNTHGTAQKKSAPITWENLKRIFSCCRCTTSDIRDCAIMAIGWSGAMRRSEIAGLDRSDLEFGEKGIVVTIRRSKTDQEGAGAQIAIPRFAGLSAYCPVSMIERWRDSIQGFTEQDGPLFFPMKDELYLTKVSPYRISDRGIGRIVKKWVEIIGLHPWKYSAHSLRRGLATECAARGVSERIIMRHTRHKNLEVARGYMDAGQLFSQNPLTVFSAHQENHESSI